MPQTTEIDTGQCVPPDQLRAYVGGLASEEQSDRIETHLARCSECEQTVVQLERDSDTLVGLLRQAPSGPPEPSAAGANVASSETSVCENEIMEEVFRKMGEHPNAGTDAGSDDSHGWQPPPDDIGAYELIRPLGRGGMASVYLARHRRLGKEVAIKLLPTRGAGSDDSIARFLREVRTAGGLSHPSIVSATDAGQQNGLHFLVMELIDGMDLSRIARAVGPLGVEDACEVIRVAAFGLAHAHATGIVHRDIKPSNLMLSRAGETKILDFGLARMGQWDEATAELTTVGQLMGTLDYMAPEQAESPGAVDYRADIYALGATLFRLLCGRAPLAAAPNLSPLAKLRLLANHQSPRLDTIRSDTPPALVELVAPMLSPSPDDRPASASHVAEALEPIAEGHDLAGLVDRAFRAEAARGDEPESASIAGVVPNTLRNSAAPPACGSRARQPRLEATPLVGDRCVPATGDSLWRGDHARDPKRATDHRVGSGRCDREAIARRRGI